MVEFAHLLDAWASKELGQFEFAVFHNAWENERVSSVEIVGRDLLCLVRLYERGEMDVLITRKSSTDVLVQRSIFYAGEVEIVAELRNVLGELKRFEAA